MMESCPACGVVFAKWLRRSLGIPLKRPEADEEPEVSPAGALLRAAGARLVYVETQTNPFIFGGRAVVYVGLLAWGWYFINLDFTVNPFPVGESFMHRINLIFHEAGHMLFRPFGRFMTILGGSLLQLLVPALLAGAFVFKYRNPFGASVCVWWLGESFMDLAPYVDDALHQQMLLLGGVTGVDRPGYHDWNNILGEFNALERAREFATLADNTGTVLMVAALAWGGWLLWWQSRRLK